MILAVLEVGDFLILGLLILVLSASTRSSGSSAQRERLQRIEDKLNFLLEHVGADYVPREKERWQRLADDNNLEAAAQEYMDQNSVLMDEASKVVEQYLADARRKSRT